ncbi:MULTISPECIES: imidazolonepropionase [unclassified Paenibacillus]|uniref:imidazolonepropionase n=1 Tax=unclassified Paenibacillus TaxID=185978 RepID=UPI002405214A|nr:MULTISPECIES: imidazolonepropionase [unclassified Paenibacillus]MDF9842174.1 imidazolonepropionase [Paenibacillus sp. PastF-2]MDF9848573.1 imidazolonepropionase [Paenibacillus sp. PastM-2]MDF9855142.1 imidazolonepropionase [Paenibacillus sp. PastF-1]MDH6480411.1 imidazolonepropionase [Paenibacillus sp. PastH-2]MDH6507841.1 imidazolonepropionase [Paenibacillus sp. PastM-3]
MIHIDGAAQIATLGGAGMKPKIGREMAELGLIEDGGIVIENERFVFVGSSGEARRYVEQHSGGKPVTVLSAAGKTVTPGLIDPHTHLVFAGSREFELTLRLQGAKYLDILQAGGGILSTTERTREASEEQLMAEAERRLDRFLAHGVTTVEAKSGYGLRLADELKQLRVARRLNEVHPVELVSTFMGAHAVPPEYKGNTDAFVRTVIEEMIPAVARAGLAEYCDVFCEEGVFTVEQSREILMAGKRWGLKPKLHADELVSGGGAELAAELGAVTADHLLHASPEGIRRMALKGVIAVLLPGTAFFLMAPPADARSMIDAGVPVALSTDRNPGSSPTESLPFIMNLACLTMRMTPAEVLTACTLNAAHAIDRAADTGSIEAGKQADLVIFDAPNYQYLQYHYAVNLTDTVLKKGRIVILDGKRVTA